MEKIAVSARTVDVLVGPAGTGKTTTLGALRRAWEREHGAGSVVGLAPSAAAADVLADDLGITTENTAKWLHEHSRGTWRLRAGQLMIVDESSLAGTLALERLATHAVEAGAKLLLVGDWAQLTAVDAGGGFGLLVVLTRIVVDVGETSVVELELSRFPRVHGGLSCPTLMPG
ncbi:AAA family ATPase [Microbacterium tenebrionis]|uniref:AAA family ATPase n=1 Tax=Microbacterium tenebrionis TaxID=2830665 RepID=UPI003FD78C30